LKRNLVADFATEEEAKSVELVSKSNEGLEGLREVSKAFSKDGSKGNSGEVVGLCHEDKHELLRDSGVIRE
jgi:hypothetical protein